MKKFQIIITIILSLFTITKASAENLYDVYQHALKSDPTYQNAIATFKDNREALPQSIAALLFSANVQGNTMRTRFNPLGTASNSTYNAVKFNSNGYQFNFTQPLLNFASFATVNATRASVKSSFATLLAAKQNLMTRVATAYFNVLYAEDTLRYTLAQKHFVGQQLEQTRQRFKVGLDAITSVYDAQASYDSIVASEISARNNVLNTREQLRQITGISYSHLARVKRINLKPPVPNNIDTWVSYGEHANLQLLSARYAMIAARENIKTAFAGHLPTLNAVGSYQYQRSHQPSLAVFGGYTETEALQLAVPLFSGGAVVSQTRQAQYRYLRAVTAMDQTHRAIVSMTRQSFNNVVAGISQIEADRQAIVSRIASLNGTLVAYRVGTRTMVDVLDDQSRLRLARQNYANDQYTFINNVLQLKQNAGTLTENDIKEISNWLQRTPNDAIANDYSKINFSLTPDNAGAPPVNTPPTASTPLPAAPTVNKTKP